MPFLKMLWMIFSAFLCAAPHVGAEHSRLMRAAVKVGQRGELNKMDVTGMGEQKQQTEMSVEVGADANVRLKQRGSLVRKARNRRKKSGCVIEYILDGGACGEACVDDTVDSVVHGTRGTCVEAGFPNKVGILAAKIFGRGNDTSAHGVRGNPGEDDSNECDLHHEIKKHSDSCEEFCLPAKVWAVSYIEAHSQVAKGGCKSVGDGAYKSFVGTKDVSIYAGDAGAEPPTDTQLQKTNDDHKKFDNRYTDSYLSQSEVSASEVMVKCKFHIMEEDNHPGDVTVAYDGFEYATCVQDDGTAYELEDNEQTEGLASGSEVTVKLRKTRKTNTMSGAPLYKIRRVVSFLDVAEVAARDRATYGLEQNTSSAAKEMDSLMILINYNDARPSYTSESKVMNDLYGTVADMISKVSYGRLTMPRSKGKVVTVRVNQNWGARTKCDMNLVAAEASSAVQSQHGISPNAYTYREFFIPSNPSGGCVWGGLAQVGCGHYSIIPRRGGCYAWYRAPNAFVRAHELGHNLGLLHAGGYSARQSKYVEYGDPEASMGASYTFSSFIAAARYNMGILGDRAGEVLTYDGRSPKTYRLQSISVPLGQVGADGVGVKWSCPSCVPKVESHRDKTGGNLWVQFRGDEGYSNKGLSSQYQNMVYVHLARPYNNRRYGQGTEMWAKINRGASFSVAGVTVKFASLRGDVACIHLNGGDGRSCSSSPTPGPPTPRPPTPRPPTPRPPPQRKRRQCFSRDTSFAYTVVHGNGDWRIVKMEELRAGDFVLSVDATTGIPFADRIVTNLHVQDQSAHAMLEIRHTHGIATMTPDHVLLVDGKYIPARDVRPNNSMLASVLQQSDFSKSVLTNVIVLSSKPTSGRVINPLTHSGLILLATDVGKNVSLGLVTTTIIESNGNSMFAMNQWPGIGKLASRLFPNEFQESAFVHDTMLVLGFASSKMSYWLGLAVFVIADAVVGASFIFWYSGAAMAIVMCLAFKTRRLDNLRACGAS